ncbi:MAG: SMI1/KNR4 family protein [Hamadaea sp.]|nr:SMI1/KNR4 family protein [Hamadaea sp.]
MEGFLERLQVVVDRHLDGFEAKQGYAPADNHVSPAVQADGVIALRRAFDGRAPESVMRFFGAVEEVSLPDFWNGYFLGPAEWSAGLRSAGEPRAMATADGVVDVLIVGSDGGGSLFAVAVDGTDPVYLLPPSAIEDGVWTPGSAQATRLADSLDDFLALFVTGLEDHVLRGGAAPFSQV